MADAHNGLGIAYYAQGKFDEAAKEYQEAIRINPNYADAHKNLGMPTRLRVSSMRR